MKLKKLAKKLLKSLKNDQIKPCEDYYIVFKNLNSHKSFREVLNTETVEACIVGAFYCMYILHVKDVKVFPFNVMNILENYLDPGFLEIMNIDQISMVESAYNKTAYHWSGDYSKKVVKASEYGYKIQDLSKKDRMIHICKNIIKNKKFKV